MPYFATIVTGYDEHVKPSYYLRHRLLATPDFFDRLMWFFIGNRA